MHKKKWKKTKHFQLFDKQMRHRKQEKTKMERDEETQKESHR